MHMACLFNASPPPLRGRSLPNEMGKTRVHCMAPTA